LNAEFSLESIPGANPYETKIRTEIAAGNAPDVFYWWANKSEPLLTAGSIITFNDALAADKTWNDSFKPGTLAQTTINDKVVGIPSGMGLAFIYYNTEILSKYGLEIPKTYAELTNVIKTLRKNNVDPFAIGAKDAWIAELITQYLLIRTGAIDQYEKAFADKKGLTDPAILQVYKMLADLKNIGAYEKGALSNDYTASENLFMNGKAAMRICYNNEIGVFNGDNSQVKGKFAVAPFPAVEGGKGDPDVWHGQPDQILEASSSSKNKEAAIEFIKLFTGPKYQALNVEQAGLIPTTNAAFDKSKLDPVTSQLLDTFANAKGIATWPNCSPAMLTEIFNTAQAIVAGQKPEDALKKLDDLLQKDK
jgi:raffinose/stachyose/melibiose transport system substrate-binding protein